MNKTNALILLICCWIGQGCREIEAPGSIGLEYYPLEEGMTWIYQIDSTYYDPFSGRQTRYNYYKKNTVKRLRVDAAGRPVYEIQQEISNSPSNSWKYLQSYSVYKDRLLVEENVGNIRTVHLIFPVKQNKTWDGNQFNNKGRQAFVYKKVGQLFKDTIDLYPNSIMVRQIDDSTFFDQQRAIHYYGTNIGLIHREEIDITTVSNNKSGYKVIWNLYKYQQ